MTIGILNRLAELQRTIPGINAAFELAPNRIIEDDELPCFINLLGDDRYTQHADDLWHVDGTYTAMFLARRAVSGVPGEASAAIIPWRDTIADFFMARPTLDGYDGILDEPDTGLTGGGTPGKVPWLGVVYLGAIFTFRFTEVRVVQSAE
jgi:hypothetical protein